MARGRCLVGIGLAWCWAFQVAALRCVRVVGPTSSAAYLDSHLVVVEVGHSRHTLLVAEAEGSGSRMALLVEGEEHCSHLVGLRSPVTDSLLRYTPAEDMAENCIAAEVERRRRSCPGAAGIRESLVQDRKTSSMSSRVVCRI